MNLIECILKIYPDWRGVVWDNDYAKIRPHELETRPIPTLAELEAVWPEVQAEIERERNNGVVKAALAEIDLKSIRALREWLAQQETAPQWIKDYEAQAAAERATLVK